MLLPVSAFAADIPSVKPPSPELTAVSVTDSSGKIEWKDITNAAGYNVYLREETGKYTKLNNKAITDNYVRLVSLLNGVPYYFAVTSVNVAGAESPASPTGMVVPVGQATKVIPFKGGARAADYRIFSVPFTSDRNRPQDVFAYFPPYDSRMWRLFEQRRDGFHEFHDITSIEPGKAYWFLSRNDTELFVSGKTVNNYEPFFVQLHPGWNVLGSPFLYPVEWEEVLKHNPDYSRFISPVIWDFNDGGFSRKATLKPFEGYYVFNSFAGDVEMLIPPVPAAPRVVDEAVTPQEVSYGNSQSDGGWLMRISVEGGTYSDMDNLIGIDPRAENGADRMDMMEPPAWSQHISLYFASSDAPGTRFASEVRKSGGEWKFIVEGGDSHRPRISWQTLTGSHSAILIDTAINKKVDMSKRDSYSFTRWDSSPREFVISVR
ncbi:MAG: fibronectin type III domain-containing protein [Nitrospinota bacterium]